MLESLNYSFRNPKNIIWVIYRIKQLRNYKKNYGVLGGPQLDKQRWRARLGILRVKWVPEFFSKGKDSDTCSSPVPPSSAEVKNEWSFTSSLLYAFVARGDNFTLSSLIILLDCLNGKWERKGGSGLGQCWENAARLWTKSLQPRSTTDDGQDGWYRMPNTKGCNNEAETVGSTRPEKRIINRKK